MSYTCSGNGKQYEGKPWMTLTMDRWDGIPGKVTFSSYLEYRKCKDKIPERHFQLVENKEDFNYLFPRVKVKQDNKTFQFLTETEINRLTNEEYRQYKLNMDDYYLLNPARAEIEESNLRDDEYVRELETTMSTTDEESDDY